LSQKLDIVMLVSNPYHVDKIHVATSASLRYVLIC